MGIQMMGGNPMESFQTGYNLGNRPNAIGTGILEVMDRYKQKQAQNDVMSQFVQQKAIESHFNPKKYEAKTRKESLENSSFSQWQKDYNKAYQNALLTDDPKGNTTLVKTHFESIKPNIMDESGNPINFGTTQQETEIDPNAGFTDTSGKKGKNQLGKSMVNLLSNVSKINPFSATQSVIGATQKSIGNLKRNDRIAKSFNSGDMSSSPENMPEGTQIQGPDGDILTLTNGEWR